jgi:type IV secretion system protein VirB4
MIVFATESIQDASESNITTKINHNISTQIFLPDHNPSPYYKTVFGLNDNEFNLLSAMSNENYHFLLKYDNDSVVASLDLSGLDEEILVLSSKPETLKIMEDAIKEKGDDPENWLPRFFTMATSKLK